MNITQIRNATQLITYAGKRFLIDPMLAPKVLIRVFPAPRGPIFATRWSSFPLTFKRCWTPMR